jgi:hypothetical protein
VAPQKHNELEQGWFSQSELEALALALAAGQDSFTGAQAEQVLEWAIRVRVDNGVLDGILNGNISLRIDPDGEFLFALTDKGHEEARRLVARFN